MFKDIEIGEIGYMRQSYDSHIHSSGHWRHTLASKHNRIFIFYMDIGHIRNDTHYRDTATLLKHTAATIKQTHVTSEFVDNNPFDQSPVFRRLQHHRSVGRCKHAATVYIGDKQHGGIGIRRHRHVHDV